MIRRLAAVAMLTLREALRSRIVLALCLLLAAVALGLPPLLKGDGTPQGVARLMLGYTMGMAFGLLALATLWTACALVSGEFASRTLQLTRVKPVPGWQLWLGKWLGLLLLDAVLLAVVGAIVYAQVQARMDLKSPTAEALLVARSAHHPVLPSVEVQVEGIMRQLPAGMAEEERRALRRQLRSELPFQAATLERGQRWTWRFEFDRPPDTRHPLWLRLRCDTDAFTRSGMRADCQLLASGNQARVEFQLADFSAREFEVRLPSAPFAGQRHLELRMTHAGEEGSGPLLLQPRQGLTLLAPRAGLARNMTSALALQLSLLALLAALGLTMGMLFSLPVAAVCATGLLLATMISAFVVSDPDVADGSMAGDSGALLSLSLAATRALANAATPALAPAPLRQLAAAELVPAGDLGRSWLINGLLLPLLCAGAGTAALARREMPN